MADLWSQHKSLREKEVISDINIILGSFVYHYYELRSYQSLILKLILLRDEYSPRNNISSYYKPVYMLVDSFLIKTKEASFRIFLIFFLFTWHITQLMFLMKLAFITLKSMTTIALLNKHIHDQSLAKDKLKFINGLIRQ